MKRFMVVFLILVVIGVGFYLGYNKANAPQKTASQVSQPDIKTPAATAPVVPSESKVLQAYKEEQAKTPFSTNPYAGLVAAINVSTSWEDSMSLIPRNMQFMIPLILKEVHKKSFDIQEAAGEELRKQIVKVDMPENPISNSVAFVYYTKPPETIVQMDLFLYEDGVWKKCLTNTSDNYDKAVNELGNLGLVIKNYQLVDDSQFQKIMEKLIAAENKAHK